MEVSFHQCNKRKQYRSSLNWQQLVAEKRWLIEESTKALSICSNLNKVQKLLKANMGVHRLALHLVVPLCFIFLIKVPRGTAFYDTNCLDIERNLGVRFYKMQFNADELCSLDCKNKGAYWGKLPDLLSQVNPTEREDYADLRPGQQDDPNPQPLVDSVEQIPQASDCVCCSNETGNGDCIEMSKREDCEFRNGNLICDTKCTELEGAISGFCDVLLDCWCCTKLNPEYDQTDMVQFEPTN